MEKVIQEWLDSSDYDFDTAEAMFKTGRYLYVLFMCQQSVEKLLKAIFVKKKSELPPRVHHLSYLADTMELKLSESEVLLLNELDQFYLESRYPSERAQLAKETDEKKALSYFEKTRGVLQCLKENYL